MIDRSVIEALRELGDDMVAEVAKLYLEDAPPRIDAIASAIDRGDPRAMAKAAHALKSSSGNVGATTVRDICAELETLGNSGTTEGTPEKLVALKNAYKAAAKALRELSRG